MEIMVDQEFKNLCSEIVQLGLSLKEWEAKESDDMFQTEHYVGGFDSIEKAFCFSYYDATGKEYFLQCSLDEIKSILDGKIKCLKVLPQE